MQGVSYIIQIKKRVLPNKEHFAVFHYISIMCSPERNMIFEEGAIKHNVITVMHRGIR